jgi:hypothetical protein
MEGKFSTRSVPKYGGQVRGLLRFSRYKPEQGVLLLLEAAIKQQLLKTEKIYVCCSYSDLLGVSLSDTVVDICIYEFYNSPINPSTNLNPVYSHSNTWQYVESDTFLIMT